MSRVATKTLLLERVLKLEDGDVKAVRPARTSMSKSRFVSDRQMSSYLYDGLPVRRTNTGS
jgi:hypothetical protein